MWKHWFQTLLKNNKGDNASDKNKKEEEEKVPLQLDVHTSFLLLNKAWVDREKRTVNILFEVAFHYDVNDYLKLFDYFALSGDTNSADDSHANKIIAKNLHVPFDIINARSIERRSESHYIRDMKDVLPENITIYKEKVKDAGDSELSLRDSIGLKNHFEKRDLLANKNYRKFEHITFSAEISFLQTERVSPFDNLHFFFGLICDSGFVGTNRIRFVFNKNDSKLDGIKTSLNGYRPINDDFTVHNLKPSYLSGTDNEAEDGKNIEWDRLYFAMSYSKNPLEEILVNYVVPFLMFNYIIVNPFVDVDALLNISATLFLANVALLLVSNNEVFTLKEQAIVTQIIVLFISTIILIFQFPEEENTPRKSIMDFSPIQWILMFFNVLVLVVIVVVHYFIGKAHNQKIIKEIEEGTFESLDSTA